MMMRIGAIASGVALSGLLAGTGMAAAQASTALRWHNVYRTRDHGQLMSVAAPGKRDAWAVGQLPSAGGGKVILHWNGVHWSKVSVTIPGAAGFMPWSVAANGPRDVWVFGMKRNTAEGEALIWTGSWQFMPLPSVISDGVVLNNGQVWGSSGSTSCGPDPANCTSTAWNWDGHQWTSSTLATDLQAIAGAGDQVWALGLADIHNSSGAWTTGRPVIYHWSGAQWTSVSSPAGRVGPFPALDASPAGHLWMAAAGVNRHKPLRLAVWNGKTWASHPIPGHLDGEPIYVPGGLVTYDGHGGAWVGPYLHWTGRRFVNAFRPGDLRWNLQAVAPIPGSRSVWGVGSYTTASTRPKTGSLIAVYGRLP